MRSPAADASPTFGQKTSMALGSGWLRQFPIRIQVDKSESLASTTLAAYFQISISSVSRQSDHENVPASDSTRGQKSGKRDRQLVIDQEFHVVWRMGDQPGGPRNRWLRTRPLVLETNSPGGPPERSRHCRATQEYRLPNAESADARTAAALSFFDRDSLQPVGAQQMAAFKKRRLVRSCN